MLAADGSISTIVSSYSARAAFGWKAFDLFYLGPEAQAFACDGYSQVRVGMHLTGFKAAGAEWSAAIGWSDDSDRRDSLYIRLGVLLGAKPRKSGASLKSGGTASPLSTSRPASAQTGPQRRSARRTGPHP
jgi:hypothetical protein